MEKKKYQLSFQLNQPSDREEEKVQLHERYSSRAPDRKTAKAFYSPAPVSPDIQEEKEEEESGISHDRYRYHIPTSPRIPVHNGRKRKREHPYSSSFLHGHQNKNRWIRRFKSSSKIVVIASSAIGIGLIFGLTVLNIFSNLAEEQGATESTKIEQPMQPEQGTQQRNTEPPDSNASTNQTEIQENPALIPTGTVQNGVVHFIPRSYYVVQAGAFSEILAAQELLKQYSEKGYAGLILDQDQQFRLFVGIATSKDEANDLGQFYIEQGFESYVKEYITPEGSLELNMRENELNMIPAFLSQGDQLIRLITQVTVNGIMNPAAKILNDDWKHIQELHRGYLQTGNSILEGWEGQEKQFGEQMIKQLSTAVNALETYQQQQHISYLWQSQQALLQYLNAYESLVQSENQ